MDVRTVAWRAEKSVAPLVLYVVEVSDMMRASYLVVNKAERMV